MSGPLAELTCGRGQIAAFDGIGWACANAVVDISPPECAPEVVSSSSGGTGSTSPPQATITLSVLAASTRILSYCGGGIELLPDGASRIPPVSLLAPVTNTGGPLTAGLKTSNFRVELSGNTLTTIRQVDIGDLRIPLTQERGKDPNSVVYRQGQPVIGHVILRRHLSADPGFRNWIDAVSQGTPDSRSLTILGLANDLVTVIVEYEFDQCSPVKYVSETDGNGLPMESITLRCIQFPMLNLSDAVSAWLNDTLGGGLDMPIDVALEFQDDSGITYRSLVYTESLISRFTFPRFDAASNDIARHGLIFQPLGVIE